MNSNETDDERAQALAEDLQRQFLAVLNADTWYACPHVVAHASAALLGSVLRAVVVLDQNDLPFALDLVERVRAHVAEVAQADGVTH